MVYSVCPEDYFPLNHSYGQQLRNSLRQFEDDPTFEKPLSVSVITPKAPFLRAADPLRRTTIMSIMNLTPDSFSDGGILDVKDVEGTAKAARRQVAEGAQIIDMGGQSSRPNLQELVTPEIEAARVLPHIEYLRSLPEFDDVPISIDTWYSDIAREAVNRGADIINDIYGGTRDPHMIPMMAQMKKTVILTHFRGTPETMYKLAQYPGGLFEEVALELRERIDAALAAGIPPWRIILDPGAGFAKTADQTLKLLKDFATLREHPLVQGYPWLIGTSKKSYVGSTTGVKNAADRVWGTAACVTAAIAGGADIVRVHDIAEMEELRKMADGIYRTTDR